jgi:hypothetical protein
MNANDRKIFGFMLGPSGFTRMTVLQLQMKEIYLQNGGIYSSKFGRE